MSRANPQIYVACLSAYNSGYLHGEWIGANQSVDQIKDEIQEMLNASPMPDAEEYAIHDYNDMPNMGEWPDLDDVVKAAELVDRHGYEAVNAYVSWHGDNTDLDNFESAYRGKFDSEEDFAIQHAEDICLLDDVPDTVSMYFDYEVYARDLFVNEFFFEDGHVFEILSC